MDFRSGLSALWVWGGIEPCGAFGALGWDMAAPLALNKSRYACIEHSALVPRGGLCGEGAEELFEEVGGYGGTVAGGGADVVDGMGFGGEGGSGCGDGGVVRWD